MSGRTAGADAPARPTGGRAARRWSAGDFLRLPLNLVQWLLAFLWTAACISAALVLYVVRDREAALRFAHRPWAPGMFVLGGGSFEVVGIPPPTGMAAIYIANHQSFLDVAAVYGAVPAPLVFVLKRELVRVPFLGWYVRAMGMVLVDRAQRSQATAVVRATVDVLRSGRSVLTFPEGTRSRDGRLGRFKTGAFGAAIEAGVPVVPIAIVGTATIVPPDGVRSRPAPVRVRIGEPILPPPQTPDPGRDRAALAELARCRVLELLAELEAPAG